MENPEAQLVPCGNCKALLSQNQLFCPECGQKQTPLKRPLGAVLYQFLGSLFQLDSRIWQTFLLLFKPGELTLEYYRGRRKRYINPFRFFFFFLVLSVALLAFNTADFRFEAGGQFLKAYEYDDKKLELIEELRSIIDTNEVMNQRPEVMAETDSILERLTNKYDRNDSITLVHLDHGNPYRFALKDLAFMTDDEIIEKYEIDGFWEKIIVRQGIRLVKSGDTFVQFLIRQSSWAALILMPFAAFLLKLLYIRRNRYFEEHFIFALHTHAMIFFIIILNLSAIYVLPTSWLALFASALTFGALLYGFVAMWRFYEQSLLKTVLKYALFLLFYFIVFLFVFIFTVLISVLVF